MNKFIFIFIAVCILTIVSAQTEKEPEGKTMLRSSKTVAASQGNTINIRKSWWEKIKESFLIASIGLFFFLFSFPLLWYNERRQVQTSKLISDAKKTVKEVDSAKISAENEGKLIYTTAFSKTQQALTDEEVNIIFEDAIKVRRRVEMLQIVQYVDGRSDRDIVGGGESTTAEIKYEPIWSENPIDSQRFHDYRYRGANPNPDNWALTSKWFKAPSVKLGEFSLSPDQIDRLLFSESSVLSNYTKEKFSAGLQAKLNTATVINQQNQITIRFKDKDIDSIGDLKISYSLYRNKDITVVASQSGTSFAPYDLTTKPLGNSRGPYFPNRGNHELDASNVCCCCLCCGIANACADSLCQTPAEVDWLFEQKFTKDGAFQQMQDINSAMTAIFRFVGFFCMWLGIFLFFFPLYEILQAIPLLTYFGQFIVAIFALVVAIPLTILVIALAWFFYRPLVTFLLILIITPFVIYLNKVGQEAEKAGVINALF